ncbi:MAG: putative acetyltransferase [Thermomicrobiales bacterium]|jgi:putative acetyltransferase|nr:putative acetyltransferase [Thermomicrobiales bacterium]MEA2532045.1 putative acetyltransferase [Thermomicrobiales bacterium]
MTQIREETPADYDAIREVNRRAFGEENVAELVDHLRDDGVVIASLVASEAGQVLGHILFSETPIETEQGVLAGAILSPLAVVPERQGVGIGSALVRRGIEVCRERGRTVLMVLGHPTYYPRFGFSAELARNVRSKYSGAGDAFMAMELEPGALAGGGTARVPAAFDLVD